MKRIFLPLMIAAVIAAGALLEGCYTETAEDFSKFNIQLPLFFRSNHINKAAPDTSVDFVNLNEYKEYRDNKDRLSKAEIISFNYWIDSLVFTNPENILDTIAFSKSTTQRIEFPFIKFYLQFAKLKENRVNWDDADSANWEAVPGSKQYLLGAFYNVNVRDYYRFANHIEVISEEVAQVISRAVKDSSAFYITTEYSPVWDQDINIEPKRYFPYIDARFDMMIRLTIDL